MTEREKHPQDGVGMSIADYEQEIKELREERNEARVRVNELTALCYQVTNHFESEFFNNQSIARTVRDKLIMTPEVWDIVNKSKRTPEQPVS